MYTRRYPTRQPTSSITPPPDYSGTALQPLSEASAEKPVIPPPPIPTTPLLGEVMASALPEYARISSEGEPVMATEAASEQEDPRLRDGASRRPDLSGAPASRPIRFTTRSPRRRGSQPTRPGAQPRYPLGIRPGEEGFRPGPRRAIRSAVEAMAEGGKEWQADDLLLLGLLFLLLNGGEETVKENLDVIVILGFLWLMRA